MVDTSGYKIAGTHTAAPSLDIDFVNIPKDMMLLIKRWTTHLHNFNNCLYIY